MTVSRRTLLSGIAGGAATLAAPQVRAQAGPLKVGVIATTSGGFASWGRQFKQAIDLYMAEKGPRAGGRQVEIIYRDETGADPPRARQLAQELVTRENVDFLAGGTFTPSAFGIAPVATEAKKPFIVLNAAAAVVTRRSPYIARTSLSLWQTAVPAAQWAYASGIREVFICVSDYAPGHDARDGFRQGFTAAGGTIQDTLAVPLNVVDFAPYVQRMLDRRPGAVFVFMPSGPSSIGFMRAFADLGGHRAGIKLIATNETDEVELQAIGDSAIGVVSAFHYSLSLDSPRNREFVAAYRRMHGAESIPNFASVAAYDGMHMIYQVAERLGGQIDGDRAIEAIKGMQIDSPRGSITIDPAERDVIQDIYIRRVERRGNELVNVAFERIAQVRDPWKQQNPA
jgi:branched-chain amino acid transport system substrate-binding protein